MRGVIIVYLVLVIVFYLLFNLILINRASTFIDSFIEFGKSEKNFITPRIVYFIILLFGACFIFKGNVIRILLGKNKMYTDKDIAHKVLNNLDKKKKI